MRTKQIPDAGQFSKDFHVQNVPPFLHESPDATVEKFLRPKNAVGQKNGGPQTEQNVRWHERKQSLLRSALFLPTEQDKHTLNVVADLGPLTTEDLYARLGLSSKPQVGLQTTKRLTAAGLIKQDSRQLWLTTKKGHVQALADMCESEERYGKKAQEARKLAETVGTVLKAVAKVARRAEGRTEGHTNTIKGKPKGQKKLFDFADLIDTDALFDDADDSTDVDSLFD
jgi:hypothetical protein